MSMKAVICVVTLTQPKVTWRERVSMWDYLDEVGLWQVYGGIVLAMR